MPPTDSVSTIRLVVVEDNLSFGGPPEEGAQAEPSPLGLQGELRITARVLSVMCFAMSEAVMAKALASSVGAQTLIPPQ